MLSMLAATQAPVIMMAQNRQAAIDRLQNNYVAKAILRNENQTRHVDAKLDHLISYQWKRLLEIQEIQIQLLQQAVSSSKHASNMELSTNNTSTSLNRNLFWNAESFPDPFTNLLLRHSQNNISSQDQLIFSHWHTEGTNSLLSIL